MRRHVRHISHSRQCALWQHIPCHRHPQRDVRTRGKQEGNPPRILCPRSLHHSLAALAPLPAQQLRLRKSRHAHHIQSLMENMRSKPHCLLHKQYARHISLQLDRPPHSSSVAQEQCRNHDKSGSRYRSLHSPCLLGSVRERHHLGTDNHHLHHQAHRSTLRHAVPLLGTTNRKDRKNK